MVEGIKLSLEVSELSVEEVDRTQTSPAAVTVRGRCLETDTA